MKKNTGMENNRKRETRVGMVEKQITIIMTLTLDFWSLTGTVYCLMICVKMYFINWSNACPLPCFNKTLTMCIPMYDV